jgi:hypothetical protein
MNLIGIDQNLYLKTYPAIVANALLLLYAIFTKPRLRPYLVIFSTTTLVDILVASKIIPIGNDDAQIAFEYIFVLIGDLRFIILLAFLLYGQKKLPDLASFSLDGSVLKPAVIFVMFDSLLIRAIEFAKPGIFAEPRYKFLTYELIFFALTFLWIFAVMPQKDIAEPERKFLKRAAIPVFIFYGLWPLADILILKGIDFGYALRVIPNITYYCLFLPWIAFSSFRAE